MGIFEKLHLTGAKKSTEGKSSDQKVREDKIPDAAQDMCCGSCDGQGHTRKKDRKR